MDEIVFYSYLEFQKNYRIPIWKRICKIPVSAFIVICIALLSIICSITFSLIPSTKGYAWIALICEVVTSLVLYVYTEQYQIKNSASSLNEYRNYCTELAKWLELQSITTKDDLKILQQRLSERIERNSNEHKEQRARIDKWMQVLAIPIVLSIISGIIASRTDLSEIFQTVFIIVFVFSMIYCMISIFNNVRWFPTKKKYAQMQRFIDDLQAILDMHITT